jgi:hypothetical protein
MLARSGAPDGHQQPGFEAAQAQEREDRRVGVGGIGHGCAIRKPDRCDRPIVELGEQDGTARGLVAADRGETADRFGVIVFNGGQPYREFGVVHSCRLGVGAGPAALRSGRRGPPACSLLFRRWLSIRR